MWRRLSKESPTGRSTILCSDHAPHAAFEKEVEFDRAPFGIVGLETELGLFLDIARAQTAKRFRLTATDRDVHGRAGAVAENRSRNVVDRRAGRRDADRSRTGMDGGRDKFESLSRNTPFDGWKLKGRAVRTIVGGETVLACCSEAGLAIRSNIECHCAA